MIKPERSISPAEARRILREGRYGVLSTVSQDGVPYGVPVNYFYVEADQAIYFHCFLRGRKLDNIRENPLVSFVVVGSEQIVPERFVTHYESVIVSGRATLITDDHEKARKLVQLCEALVPASLERRDQVIRQQLAAVTIVKIAIAEISGKRNQDD